MANIINTYRESMPRMRFVGKCYTNADRGGGGFGAQWDAWFSNGWFDAIKKANPGKILDNSHIGLMSGSEMSFTYWIGIFCAEDAVVPEGYAALDLPAMEAGICWIQGQDGPALYMMHDACEQAMKNAGMEQFYQDDQGRFIFFERYNCPRYTTPDEQGRVILDYGGFLA